MPQEKVPAKNCATCGGPIPPKRKLQRMTPKEREDFDKIWLKLLRHPSVAPILDEQLRTGRKIAKILSVLQLIEYEHLERDWFKERKGRQEYVGKHDVS